MTETKGTPVREILAEQREGLVWGGRSPLARSAFAVRDRALPGETPAQAKARWTRERLLEIDRENEQRRVPSGQILPVRYDD